MTRAPKNLVGERHNWKDQPKRLVNDGEDSMSKQPEALRLADALETEKSAQHFLMPQPPNCAACTMLSCIWLKLSAGLTS
jgi:hypothetical protein